MSFAFLIPFKVNNQAIWRNHTLKLCIMYPCVGAIHHTFVCKNEIQMGFAQIMGPCLCTYIGWKVSSEVFIMLQWDRICYSGRKQYSLKVLNIQTRGCNFFFIQKSVKPCYITLGLLVMQALYINSVFLYS